MQDAGLLTVETTDMRLAVRALCEANHLDFCKFFFRSVMGERFDVGPHHVLIADVLERVEFGELNRVIINIPPGYTKTMECVVMWIARMLAKYINARFIHTSFSETLVMDNSTQVRDVIQCPEYQALWPCEIRSDVSKKGLWRTLFHGGMLAAPAKGTITGFRAGRMNLPHFSGALVIDDPLKPDDQFKKPERENVNNRFNTTMRNRLANDKDTPIIVIMQRLHIDDLSGFLLKGGSGDYWHHLNLPVVIDHGTPYPSEYTHGIPIKHNLPEGPLWEKKHNREQIEVLKAAEYVFASQYMQNPMQAGGAIFRRPFQYWSDLPNLAYRVIYADTAQKDKDANDYSVFQCWGKEERGQGRAFLLDQIRGKWLAPDLKKNAEMFWAKHKADSSLGMGALRVMKVEDKVSGTGLIQSLEGIPVEAIPRSIDKVTRGMDAAPAINSGLVWFPKKAEWLQEFESEVLSFPGGSFDDQVDPMMDAITDMIGTGKDILDLL